MLATDINDLAVAFVLLVFFVAGGVMIQNLDVLGENKISIREVEIDDDKDLFLLSYVKTETDERKLNRDKFKVHELILNAENDDGVFEILKEETRKIMRFNFVEDYDVRVVYSSGEKRFGNEELTDFYEIKIPDENGDIIFVKVGLVFIRETIL
ncbi:MAG: hypothetical protein CMH62_02245 [Nanoarchaeota archaeon]|nr:hypothetical protein [Nanoarchaeota archaeon]|tara:strand:- start:3161 stop:3622 length:462 start_codon:yes stop_codon:yes gene_type:complete